MLVSRYNLKDKNPTLLANVPGRRKWLVSLYVSDGTEQITKTVRNKQPATLPEFLDQTLKELHEMYDELDQVIDGGFTIRLLR
jgi:hypothetical protein